MRAVYRIDAAETAVPGNHVVAGWPRLSRLSFCVSAAALLALSIAACAGEPQVAIRDASGAKKAVVTVEIADTAPARELGLMFRQRLDRDAGMLFVFKQPQHLTFWMKNTEIPLDMIFAEADGKIAGIVANAEPFSEQQLSVGEESQFVLEVNAGFAQRHGIKPGDRLQFLGARPSAKD
jgi:uncharacterized membrane protein (UPF0127 family)